MKGSRNMISKKSLVIILLISFFVGGLVGAPYQ